VPGLSLGVGGGLRLGGPGAVVPSPAPSSVAPVVAAYGPGATVAVGSGSKAGPGHYAIAAGFVSGALIGLTWWSLPAGERNSYGRLIFTIGLGVVFFKGISIWGKVHVAEGQTQGFSGTLYRTASLL